MDNNHLGQIYICEMTYILHKSYKQIHDWIIII